MYPNIQTDTEIKQHVALRGGISLSSFNATTMAFLLHSDCFTVISYLARF